jgi:phage-related protein
MDKQQFISELSRLKPRSTFLTLKGYRNQAQEVADYSIVFHISYRSALERSIEKLEKMKLTEPLQKQAQQELLTSFRASLEKMEDVHEDLDEAYERYMDEKGNTVKGVKRHKDTNTLHLYGSVVHKRVILPGEYQKKNQKALTVAKDKLRRTLPVGAFRQFKIEPGQVEKIVVENISFLPSEK